MGVWKSLTGEPWPPKEDRIAAREAERDLMAFMRMPDDEVLDRADEFERLYRDWKHTRWVAWGPGASIKQRRENGGR